MPLRIPLLALAALPWAAWLAFQLVRLSWRGVAESEFAAWLRRGGLPARVAAICALLAVVAVGGNKGGGSAPQSAPPPMPMLTALPAPEPSLSVVSVRTNRVAFRAASSNAVEAAAWRRIGGTEAGVWIEDGTNAPLFRIGTTPIFRAYASMSGAVTFESMRRPPVGRALPDSPPASQLSTFNFQPSTLLYPALCPFRAPLGFIPEANWGGASRPGEPLQSRFWHDALPGGGVVLTWEDALVDRLPGRRVSVQAELRPSGDCVFRYDFPDALDPPPTNLVIGAQGGTNGVNALAILETNVLSATVWNVDGTPVTNGVPLAGLLCTNGVLRTPATFEIRWRNTTGLNPGADIDGDGLTDWEEIFLHGTDPALADTDLDGLADGAEMAAGTNPLDADADGDGIPDGVPSADWVANPLWASNATNGAVVTVTLRETIATGSAATLLFGDIAIPLRQPASWSFAFEPGTAYDYRLFVAGGAEADLAITANPTPPTRGGGGTPLWSEGGGSVFDGPSKGGAGKVAVPKVEFAWSAPGGTGHFRAGSLCVHGGGWLDLTPSVLPAQIGAEWVLENLREAGGGVLRLDLPATGAIYAGTAFLASRRLREGTLSFSFAAHRSDAGDENPFCSVCGCYDPLDASLDVYPRTLTLKHDNRATLSVSHPHSPGVAYTGVQFEIRQPGYTGWRPVAGNVWTARIAGTFQIRAAAVADGRPLEVGPVTVWVRFPSEAEMMSDPVVHAHATNLWAQTLSLCTPTNRHEVGCWIRLDTSTDTYSFTATTNGPPTPNYRDSLIDLGLPPSDAPFFPNLQHAAAVYTVSSFHTHTPTTYRAPGDPRIAGPSQDDKQASVVLQMPSIVFDYEKPSHMTNGIPMGHPMNAPARLYPTGEVERRPN